MNAPASALDMLPTDQRALIEALHAYINDGNALILEALHAYIAERLGKQASDLLKQMVERDGALLPKLEAMASAQAAVAAASARPFGVLADRREALVANTSAWLRRIADTASPFTEEA